MNPHEIIIHPIIKDISFLHFYYIVIETKYSFHHIEKTNYQDRGKIKWVAETKLSYFKDVSHNEEAQRSHIDDADLFPRLYFLPKSFIDEFIAWCEARELTITNIKHKEV